MAYLVCATAQLSCSMGTTPTALLVIRPKILVDHKPAANVMDYKPFVNIPTFGMCNATSNPMVIATTAAALGVHTPAPCVPNITSPWSPGASKVKCDKQAALHDSSKANCMWSGSISISSAGQSKVKVK